MTPADEAFVVVIERAEDYAPPAENMAATADIWTGILRHKLRPGVRLAGSEVALCMVGVKLSRESYRHKRDNIVDGHGYLGIAGDLAADRGTKP
jgi:hypothetical protein